MLIVIQTKKYTANIDYIDDKNITLKSGALLGIESASLDANNKSIRNNTNYVNNNSTLCDLTFKSKSAIASFIVGSPQSGNRFFAPYLGTNNQAPQQNASVNNTTTQPQQQASQTQNNNTNTSVDNNKLAKQIITFCKDFVFNPDNRCLNTLKYVKDPSDYLVSFMELTNYPTETLEDAKSKFRSYEWKELMKSLNSVIPSKTGRINQRLIIKYGSAGTGKTTDAIRQYPNAVKIVASASADPDDLFTRFDPSTKTYVLTELGNAMQNGQPIIVDELNLFNQVILQRLQGCLDNTETVVDRNIKIDIKDGFLLIATMNLETNLGKTPLPNPLVSRAMSIENYDSKVNVDLGWVW